MTNTACGPRKASSEGINPGNGIFNMYGDYTLIEGSFLFSLQNIISKKFIIESGSMIQWTGEPVDDLKTPPCKP